MRSGKPSKQLRKNQLIFDSSGEFNPTDLCAEVAIKKYDTIDKICSSLNVDCNQSGWPDDFGRKIRQYLETNAKTKIRVLSLFSGAGGLDIGFHDANFEIIESVELEEQFSETLKMNSADGKLFSGSKVNCIDIRDYSARNLKNIDFVIGGPPCQTFSAAGRRANGVLGTTDSRGTLFREYVRILEETDPKGFLFENVYGITGANGGKPWEEIKASFSEIGYSLFYRILDAADYGVPQHRERLIIVGLKDGVFHFPRPLFGPDSLDGHKHYSAGDAVADLAYLTNDQDAVIKGKYSEQLIGIPPGLNYSFYTEEMGNPNAYYAWRSKFSDFLYKADPDVPVRTIKAQGGQWTGPIHWNNRHFTISEYKRLQTFPDDYEIYGVDQVKLHQIGNSVPPQFARFLALSIAEQVFSVELPFRLSYLDDDEELSFRKNKRQLTEVYKKKAKEAIGKQAVSSMNIEGNRKYTFSISRNFKISEDDSGEFVYSIHSSWNTNLDIVITSNNSREEEQYNISIRPVSKWLLPISSIVVHVFDTEDMTYVACWKVIENELKRHDLKENLVQLNGYYQYKPKIECILSSPVEITKFNILKPILNNSATRQILPTERLAEILNIGREDVLICAEWLKNIGYEIRNHHTNPQIEPDYWLIPYAFPSLTNLSVQLNKKLCGE